MMAVLSRLLRHRYHEWAMRAPEWKPLLDTFRVLDYAVRRGGQDITVLTASCPASSANFVFGGGVVHAEEHSA